MMFIENKIPNMVLQIQWIWFFLYIAIFVDIWIETIYSS